MALELEAVVDLATATRWQALDARAVPLDHPGLRADPVDVVLAEATVRSPAERLVLLVASEDGVDVANATVWLPLLENTELATILFAVDPARRRRGLGAELAARLGAFARGEGRRRALGFVGSPVDGPDGPGSVLARRLGATPALEVLRRELDLEALGEEDLDALVAGGERLAAGYEAVTWVDRVPEALVDDAAALLARMSTDVPMGELDWDAERWDAARFREREDHSIACGRRRVAAGAVERSTGRLVAYTDVGLAATQPEVAHQWDTIVDPDHRGHRLGMLVKVANLRQLRAVEPGARRLQTYNAADNAHMVAINKRLGFRAVERSTHWQVTL